MNFEEVYARYENGTATPEERALVEAELTKLRLLENRLAREELPPLPEAENAAREVKALDRRMARRTRRQMLACVGVLLACLLVLQVAVMAHLNRRVLDLRQWQTQGYTDFDLAMSAFADVAMPLGYYQGSWADSYRLGSGLPVTLQFGTPDGQQQLHTTLTLGRLKSDSADAWEMQRSTAWGTVGYFRTRQADGALPSEERNEALYGKLTALPDYVTVTAAVRFSRDLTLEELLALHQQYGGDGLTFLSAALDLPSRIPELYLRLTDMAIGFGDDVPYDQFRVTDPTAENYRTHLESMLQCLMDHPAVARWGFPQTEDGLDGLSSILNDVRQNGVRTYGVWVQGSADDLLRLLEDGNVSGVFIRDARLDLWGTTGK